MDCADPRRGPTHYARIGLGVSNELLKSMLTTEKVRALVDNIRGKKDRDIEGEVVKKDDDDG